MIAAKTIVGAAARIAIRLAGSSTRISAIFAEARTSPAATTMLNRISIVNTAPNTRLAFLCCSRFTL